ncbi:Rubrerythrin [Candidatus Xiphinematobacter sp. Idaho Grape]|uniref:ferritin family protein n=1 Tax=Candidatus Xiphinematobacter sp. Idaho Grape TaxID=1704307 RepID=UPI000705B4B9|nr:ferritin family protein [Candidatus Xiphinematobacter sp. Idaho Grape]ALJ56255.1 Rubrerythrin [Candidatus Xiphinematobacter sp. Idaho Grape]
MRTFESLNSKEILALAISLEEEDARIYRNFADALQSTHPKKASDYGKLGREESGHRRHLLEIYQTLFGFTTIPSIRRRDIRGFISRNPVWLIHPFNAETAAREAETIETETKHFYELAARKSDDITIQQLLEDLAEAERSHELSVKRLRRAEEKKANNARLFVLQVVQPGLVGLMDGSVSTLAPVFAAALATHRSWETFLVGLAASVGAGISMGFAEALSDDGSLTGRGQPWARGGVCGLMTILGGIGHTLPYLIIHEITIATPVAIGVVVVELFTIAWVRHRYMAIPWTSALFQVVAGGLLVFFAGMLIGNA